MVSPKKRIGEPNEEIINLLKKLLVLQLFGMNVRQVDIAKKLKMDIHAVNGFLKGIRKTNVKNGAD